MRQRISCPGKEQDQKPHGHNNKERKESSDAHGGIRTQTHTGMLKPHQESLRIIVETLIGHCRINYHLEKLRIYASTANSA